MKKQNKTSDTPGYRPLFNFKIALCFLLLLVGRSINAQSCLENYMRSGQKLFASGHYKEAIIDFEVAKTCPEYSISNELEINDWIKRAKEKRAYVDGENKHRASSSKMLVAGYLLLGRQDRYQTVVETSSNLNLFFDLSNSDFQNEHIKRNALKSLYALRIYFNIIESSSRKYNSSKTWVGSVDLKGFSVSTPLKEFTFSRPSLNEIETLISELKDGDRIIIKNCQVDKGRVSQTFPQVENVEDLISKMIFEFTINERDSDKDGILDEIDYCPNSAGPLCNRGCPLEDDRKNESKISSEKIDDIYYQVIKIGSQVWTVENLNVSTFQNGDPIPNAKTKEEWIEAYKNGKPAWCYYDNNERNGSWHGKLYNLHAITDKRGIAPKGFHIPSPGEWNTLITFLGGKEYAGIKLKSKGYFNSPCANITEFSGNYSGLRLSTGSFDGLGQAAYWYSTAAEIDNSNIYYIGNYYPNEIDWSMVRPGQGCSVRCIKD